MPMTVYPRTKWFNLIPSLCSCRKGRARKDLHFFFYLQVIATTREHFSHLPIQLFFPLYVAFMIWPPTFLEEYLQQYEVPNDVKITDGTWTQFFVQVSERYVHVHVCHIAYMYTCVYQSFYSSIQDSLS